MNDDRKPTPPPEDGKEEESEDLSDMLQELRILLQGVQVLTGFLVVLPFSEGFAKLNQSEKWVYLATFSCALFSLVLFAAPAAHHRLARPLMDRVRFKVLATRMIIIGLIPLSAALVLSTHLVVNEVAGVQIATIAAGIVTLVIGIIWWLYPMMRKKEM